MTLDALAECSYTKAVEARLACSEHGGVDDGGSKLRDAVGRVRLATCRSAPDLVLEQDVDDHDASK